MLLRENLEKMNKEEDKKKVLEDPDFIKNTKSGNSLSKYLTRNERNLDNFSIARLLIITEEEVEEIYQKAVSFIKKNLNK